MTNPDPLGKRAEVAVWAIAECAFSIADAYATEYLRRAEANGPAAVIRVPWPLPLPAMRHRVALSFGLHLDVREGGRSHDEVRLGWSSGSVLLPDFRGALRFRIDPRGTRVLLDGSYSVPLGALGRSFDRLVGVRIARASLQDLADRIAAYLTEREREWRREHPGDELTVDGRPAAGATS
jgi:hypothetical protein